MIFFIWICIYCRRSIYNQFVLYWTCIVQISAYIRFFVLSSKYIDIHLSTSQNKILRSTKEKVFLKFPFSQSSKGVGVKKHFRSSLRMAYRKIHDLELKNTLLKRQNKRIQKRFERTTKEQNKDGDQKGIKNLPGTPTCRSITRL